MIGATRLNRRGFLAASLAALATPRAICAQQPNKVSCLAILIPSEPVDSVIGTKNQFWKAFFQELRRLGYREGQNLAVEPRSAEGDEKRIPAIARETVGLQPDVVFTIDPRLVEALKAVTTTIPIVTVVGDPVGSGYAVNLARPGGNVTGFSIDPGLEIIGKRIALLKEAVPAASRMAWLTPRRLWESRLGEAFREAARTARISMVDALLESPADEAEYRRVFAAMVRDRVDSLYVGASPESYVNRQLIAELTAEARLPAIYLFREHVEAGGLMAYAVDLVDIWRRAAGYVDRILKGANPAEMPFQQPTKFELIVNLKTAKALGLTIPDSMLACADEVIE